MFCISLILHSLNGGADLDSGVALFDESTPLVLLYVVHAINVKKYISVINLILSYFCLFKE